MFIHNIDPVLISIGPLEIRYYGLIFVIGFILAYFILKKLAKEKKIALTPNEISDYLFYVALGTVIGARLFYVLVYNPMYYLPRPLEMFYLWQGGLSFHGGLLGAVAAIYFFVKSKKGKISFREIADLSVIPLALGLALGRIANFINGELPGNVTNVSWCVHFHASIDCRHPSQLYASAKNFFIFGTLWFLRNKPWKPGTLAGVFMVMYAVLRFIVGFFRAPDPQLGYIIGSFTMGQILNTLLFIAGIAWLYWVNKK